MHKVQNLHCSSIEGVMKETIFFKDFETTCQIQMGNHRRSTFYTPTTAQTLGIVFGVLGILGFDWCNLVFE